MEILDCRVQFLLEQRDQLFSPGSHRSKPVRQFRIAVHIEPRRRHEFFTVAVEDLLEAPRFVILFSRACHEPADLADIPQPAQLIPLLIAYYEKSEAGVIVDILVQCQEASGIPFRQHIGCVFQPWCLLLLGGNNDRGMGMVMPDQADQVLAGIVCELPFPGEDKIRDQADNVVPVPMAPRIAGDWDLRIRMVVGQHERDIFAGLPSASARCRERIPSIGRSHGSHQRTQC